MTAPPALPSDRQLLDAARRGDDAAWTAFIARHRRSLVELYGDGRAAEREADEMLPSVRRALLTEEPTPAGTPAIRVPRAAVLAHCTNGWFGPRHPDAAPDAVPNPGAGPDSVTSQDDELLAAAFSTLPEPWQTVLWHRHVDGDDPVAVAPHVGRRPDEVPELVATAERGLVDALVREYQQLGPLPADAASIVPLLAPHHHGTLGADDERRVLEHLQQRHIAVAPPPPPPAPLHPMPAPTGEPSAVDAPPAAAAFPPPTLRRHDAVDSLRLLELAGSLDRRLGPAIAPGICTLHDVPPDPSDVDEAPVPMMPPGSPAFVPADGQPDPSDGREGRRRWIPFAIVGALVVLVVVVGLIVGGSGDGSDEVATEPDPAPPATVDPPEVEEDPPAGDPDSADDDVDTDADVPEDADPVDGDPDTTEPPSPNTSLDLRPDSEGPISRVGITLDDGAPAAQGFAPATAPAGLSLAVTSPAPVYAGASGTFDLEVADSTGTPRSAGLTFTLPRGVRLDPSGLGGCNGLDEGIVRCVLDVPADAAATASIRLLLEPSVVGRLQIEGDLEEPLLVPIAVTRDLVHSSVGNGGVLVIGNTVMRCSPGPAAAVGVECGDVTAGVGDIVNRWDVPVEFIGRIPEFGLFNSSSADLELPDGAVVVEAHLYWSGDLVERGATIPDDGRNETIALGLPGGRVRTIEAGRVRLGDVDASQYLGSNDVTDFVREGGAGEYTAGNIQTVEVQGSYGGWALVVVYDHPDEPRRHRLVTKPFHWVAPEDETGEVYEYEADLAVPAGAATAELDMFALEGELGFLPEQFVVGGQELGEGNAFDSTIRGPRNPELTNSLGVDIDTYALDIDASDGLLPIRSTSDQDGIRIAVLALSVDLPS